MVTIYKYLRTNLDVNKTSEKLIKLKENVLQERLKRKRNAGEGGEKKNVLQGGLTSSRHSMTSARTLMATSSEPSMVNTL